MTLLLERETNIKTVTIPEPLTPIDPFPRNLDEYFTDEDWTGLTRFLINDIDTERDLGGSAYIAARLKIAFPQRTNSSIPLEKLFTKISAKQGAIGTVEPIDIMILFPDRIGDIYVNLGNFLPTFDFIKEFMESSIDGQDKQSIRDIILQTFIFLPDRISELGRTPGLEDFLLNEIELDRQAGYLLGVDYDAVAYRLLYGYKGSKMSPDDWKSLRSGLKDWRTIPKKIVCELAANIAILAAERVQMTSSGLQIIMPGTDAKFEVHSPIPVSRKF